ncbi:MAG: ribonuclease III [Nitrospirae bacterium]|nr:ribonuclease III [Nitrospirota bacterium]
MPPDSVLESPRDPYFTLERRIGYTFRDRNLLIQALTHKSFAHESRDPRAQDNERLEFLGDAILNLTICDYLVRTYPELPEGDLSKYRSLLVSETILTGLAQRLDLGPHLRLGKGEEQTRGWEKPSILSDALEALIAALYLDGGMIRATTWVQLIFQDMIRQLLSQGLNHDFKTDLQEYCQSQLGVLPLYRVIGESGPDHDKRFEVEILVREEPMGTGAGRSKKEAEQEAAREALARLKSSSPTE